MIVMGTHGRTGLMWFPMGSVAEAVGAAAPCCPVVTLRQPGGSIEAAAPERSPETLRAC